MVWISSAILFLPVCYPALAAAAGSQNGRRQLTNTPGSLNGGLASGLFGLIGGLTGGGGGGGGIASLLGALDGGLGKFLGEPEATEALTSLAKMLGATRSSPGSIHSFIKTTMNVGYGPVRAPTGSAPEREVLPSRANVTGAQTIKLRYGPYSVPNMNHRNGMGLMGMLSGYPHKDLQKPCTGECTIIGMSAGLEYLDGTNANINTGMWLHHMVLFAAGPGRFDPPCTQRDVSVPHVVVGHTAHTSERIFASGNERTPAILPEWGVRDAGYKLKSTDSLAAAVELMNVTPEDKTVWMTVTYDIVPGHPYKDDVKIVWFDVRQCGTSEYNPPKGQNQFTIPYQWRSTVDGEILGTVGHLHDGGTHLTLAVDGKQTCDSVASYGTEPEFVSPPSDMAGMGGEHSHAAATEHLSKMTLCYGNTFSETQMRKGQTWDMTAHYDFSKFRPMTHDDGQPDEVMGISIMFVRVKG